MNDLIRAHRQLDRIRKEWPEGSRIVLVHMGGDDPSPVPDNSAGTVRYVDDIGTIHVAFDNGRRMGLIAGGDEFVHEAGGNYK